jgi:predicted glycosyltransferase involved in capsule biosynthesis
MLSTIQGIIIPFPFSKSLHSGICKLFECVYYKNKTQYRYLLIRMVDNIEDIKSKECRRYIEKMSKIVFSDYRLIYKFADKCHNDIQKLSCGRLETQQVEVCDQIMFV